eukprot:TRINITY_DN661_c0_g1_i1.p1 TRINITY_DN661_c0_g1~~TRINITY_DN661_c0_g1_i1.p1  ORF type:complete len:438 (+),score=137.05 TRINITY_DN661_c0_g1_i1:166-1314(+)
MNLGAFGSAGYGGVAAKDLEEGEFIVRVPRDAVITLDVALTDGPFPDQKQWNTHHEILQLFVLNEQLKPNSPWKPYLDILPKAFPDHPLLWTDDELAQFDASPAKNTIAGRRQQLQSYYTGLVENVLKANPGVLPEGYVTYERYLWSYLAVTTRSWVANNTMCMVPLADMMNHDPLAGSGTFSSDGQFFDVKTTAAVENGKQVFLSYGAKSNHDLLTTYGFYLEENIADHMLLTVNLKPNSLVASVVEPLLKQHDPNYSSNRVFPNRRPDSLLRVFRLSQMKFSELEYINDALQMLPVTIENELRAYRSAMGNMQHMLAGYSTTIEQDQEVLDNPETPKRLRMATFLRQSEKKILKNQILVLGKMWENILVEGTLPHGVPIR